MSLVISRHKQSWTIERRRSLLDGAWIIGPWVFARTKLTPQDLDVMYRDGPGVWALQRLAELEGVIRRLHDAMSDKE